MIKSNRENGPIISSSSSSFSEQDLNEHCSSNSGATTSNLNLLGAKMAREVLPPSIRLAFPKVFKPTSTSSLFDN